MAVIGIQDTPLEVVDNGGVYLCIILDCGFRRDPPHHAVMARFPALIGAVAFCVLPEVDVTETDGVIGVLVHPLFLPVHA